MKFKNKIKAKKIQKRKKKYSGIFFFFLMYAIPLHAQSFTS